MIDEEPLTARQKQTCDLLSSGLTNAEIAQILGISPCTVADHLKVVYQKLGVNTRTEAATVFLRREVTRLSKRVAELEGPNVRAKPEPTA